MSESATHEYQSDCHSWCVVFVSLPSSWDWIPPRPDRINDAALVELRQHIPHHSKERQRIINQFKSTMPSSKIHAIHRIQNATLYRNYERSRLELTQRGVKFNEVKDLFHGTRLVHPREIYGSNVGFDVSKCKSY